MGKQIAPGHPAEGLLTLPGAADTLGDGGAAQIALGNTGRGNAVTGGVKHRSAVHLAEHKHRAQRQFHCGHIPLIQGIAHRQTDGPADQLQIILQTLFLKLAGLTQPEADAQRGKQHDGQHHKQQQRALQAIAAKSLQQSDSCIHFDRVFFAHV